MEYRIPVETHDEIGVLTEAFNKLTDDLYEYTQDILELSNANSRLEVAAYTDGLTGILNRVHFKELAQIQMENAARTKTNTFLIMFDVDRFKRVNDSYGHSIGDVVLKAITSRVQDVIRPYDLFARYGGEEFVLLVTCDDGVCAQNLAESIRRGISEAPILYEDVEISVTASFGVAPASPPHDLDAAIDLADAALYQAKNEGRNKVAYVDKSS